MSYEAVVVLVVGIGVVAGIVLLVAAWRRMPPPARGRRGGQSASLGMSVGMLFGAALGTIVWLSTGQFVFWVIFMGAGMTLGMAIGQARADGRR